MRKSFIICLAFVLTFFTLPFGGLTALADSEIDLENLSEGVYTLDYTFLEKGTDSASTMDGFTEGPAYVKVDEDGHQFVAVTFTSASMIKWFKVNGQDVTNLQEDEENDTKIVEFTADNLMEKQAGNVFVEVPGMYSTEHEVDLEFVEDSLETVEVSEYPGNAEETEEEPESPEEPEDSEDENGSENENGDDGSENGSEDNDDETEDEPENPDNDNGSEDGENGDDESEDGSRDSEDNDNGSEEENEDNGSDSEDESNSDNGSENESDENDETEEPEILEDGTYEVDFTVTYPGMDVDEYFTKPAILNIENGTQYIQMEHNSTDFIKALSISNGDVDVISEDEDNETRIVGFDVDGDLSEPMEMGMVMFYGMTHDVQVDFDIDSIQMIEQQPEEPENPDSELDPGSLDEGVYTSDYTFLEKGTDDASTMDGFTEGPAYVKVDEDGNQLIALKMTGTDMIQWFKVNDQYAKVLQEDEENKTRVVEFKVDNLTEKQSGNVYVEVPGMYSTEHEVDLVFAADSIQTAKDSDYPEDHNVEQPGETEDPKEPEDPEKEPISELDPEDLDEGVYTSDYTFLEKGTDDPSAMDGFTEGPAYVKVDEDGNQFVALTLTSANWIKGFKINNKDAKVLQENKKENTRVVEFAVGNLTEKQAGSVSVDVPGVYATEHEVDLVFAVDSLVAVDNDEYPENENVDPSKELGSSKDPSEDKNDEKPGTSDEKSELIPDKAYEIDYVIKHETEDRASAADNFFEKPGHLLYVGDEKFIQLTINNWAMIDWLRTEHGGEVMVVKENDDGSALIQFKVEGELSEVINLSMSVTVPNVYEDKVHEARLILDLDSKTEVDATDFRVIVDEKTPTKPKFGDNDDTDKNGDDGTVKPDKTDNPQTGDTTNILLYAMLLIGSLVPLAVKLKRRFV